jgi:hypothetical protein
MWFKSRQKKPSLQIRQNMILLAFLTRKSWFMWRVNILGRHID